MRGSAGRLAAMLDSRVGADFRSYDALKQRRLCPVTKSLRYSIDTELRNADYPDIHNTG
jgi:hypothetical protein